MDIRERHFGLADAVQTPFIWSVQAQLMLYWPRLPASGTPALNLAVAKPSNPACPSWQRRLKEGPLEICLVKPHHQIPPLFQHTRI